MMLKGEIILKSPIDIDVVKEKTYYWCSCGKSKKQPFYDGSNKGSEFSPKAYKAEESKKTFSTAVSKPKINQFVMNHIKNYS